MNATQALVHGLSGFALGLFASALNLGGLWLGIKLFTTPTPGVKLKNQTPIVVLACFVKMPVFIFAGFLTSRIGSPAPGCFLAAVGLVYSVTILWVAKAR